jgi:hypothetical protein
MPCAIRRSLRRRAGLSDRRLVKQGVGTVLYERGERTDAQLAAGSSADAAASAALVEPRLNRTLRTARATPGNDADAREATQVLGLPRRLFHHCRFSLRRGARCRDSTVANPRRTFLWHAPRARLPEHPCARTTS